MACAFFAAATDDDLMGIGTLPHPQHPNKVD